MTDEPGSGRSRRRPMERIGELIPEAARRLGLEDELRVARAGATWDALVAERVPPAVGACRLVRAEGGVLLVEADAPIVGQELRLRSPELLAAFRAAPGGFAARELRVVVRRV
jgi:predicted nucleic acid-binding Zn ribbon protein